MTKYVFVYVCFVITQCVDIYIYIQLEYLSGLEPGTKLGTMNPLHDCTCLEVVLQLR